MAVAFRSATRIASFFGAVEGDAAGSGTRGRTPNVAGGGGSLRRLRSLSSFPPPLSPEDVPALSSRFVTKVRGGGSSAGGFMGPRGLTGQGGVRGRRRGGAATHGGPAWAPQVPGARGERSRSAPTGKGRPSGEPELPARADLAPFRWLDLVRLFDPHFCRAPTVARSSGHDRPVSPPARPYHS
ncbi:hypothetical protein QYE76_047766 [Lolium multiflorum]|uniref:Uncharacterized protein n=1 Tax=Lolium multiflorum TaxID=4521 RepID=A0AAD8TSI2_LOLMU|nr:hypothetical protein QYE76_047766 [Lolium multiflorum]